MWLLYSQFEYILTYYRGYIQERMVNLSAPTPAPEALWKRSAGQYIPRIRPLTSPFNYDLYHILPKPSISYVSQLSAHMHQSVEDKIANYQY